MCCFHRSAVRVHACICLCAKVFGDNVVMYGLAVEHTEQDLLRWEGNNGKVRVSTPSLVFNPKIDAGD